MDFLRRILPFVLLLSALVFRCPAVVSAGQDEQQEDYISMILQELDLGGVDDYTARELPQKTTFSGLVQTLLTGENGKEGAAALGGYVLDLFFY